MFEILADVATARLFLDCEPTLSVDMKIFSVADQNLLVTVSR